MARFSSGSTPPIGHWKNVPIYLTTILTALFVLGLVLSAVLAAAHSPLLGWFVFTMPLDPGWSLWRLFSYVFVNQISFFTPFSIFFFYWMSVGIETHLGRPTLVRLLTLLALVVPAVAAAWWFGLDRASSTFGNGDYVFFSGMLVAFATLYPTTEAFGWVPFKWVAFACIACGSLMLLAGNQWVDLTQLLASCGVAFAFMRQAAEAEHDDYESPLARLNFWWRSRKFKVVKPAPHAREKSAADATSDDLDLLLDKIAKSGINSLTSAERNRLEKAREALLKKERR